MKFLPQLTLYISHSIALSPQGSLSPCCLSFSISLHETTRHKTSTPISQSTIIAPTPHTNALTVFHSLSLSRRRGSRLRLENHCKARERVQTLIYPRIIISSRHRLSAVIASRKVTTTRYRHRRTYEMPQQQAYTLCGSPFSLFTPRVRLCVCACWKRSR